ncbi:1-phosphofructokinase [Dictyobacter arantiisoli]|uniref:1-phosphofructokinase n=1 Tax=Dictyobacter arantiisoli TaxID=2014874 RepID=A0A5A5TJT2_9CHLR|nr:1-phosphofructokinase [Dictyobacter arantiisoli]GCF11336.1 1-phosphofructokinase [Dictyobacter arantiisoli]
MNSIATITLNPAVDLTVRADHFTSNRVNRGQTMQMDAGGKGINVASFLADYGLQSAATGFLGQANIDIFEQLFARKQIADHFVRLPGATRTSIKIVDEANQQTTDINMPGLQPTQENIQQLVQRIEQMMESCTWFILAGNLPPGVPADIYARLIKQLKSHHKKTVLDTSQIALQAGVAAEPTIIKPNIDELEQLLGQKCPDEHSIEQAARQLLQGDIQLVVISMGAQGAMFVDRQTSLIASALKVAVKSTVGAGDAMVAGLIAGLTDGLSLADCARLATAFSAGTITQIGPHLPARQVLQEYAQCVTIRAPQQAQPATGKA